MATQMELASVIGFGGDLPNGLLLHPDGKTLIYALGSTIVLRDRNDPTAQEFLQGHSDKVSCLALSRSGRYLASGQTTFMGFTADVIVWDLESRSLLHRMGLHKVKVQGLDFSCDERLLASLGGQDDNNLVLWDVATGAAICGTPTNYDFTLSVKFLNNRPDALVTCGHYNLSVWHYDAARNHLSSAPAQLGHLRRICKTLTVDAADEFAYVGTTSGDVLQVSVDRMLLRNTGPGKHPIQMGATASCLAPTGDLVVGGGDGSVTLLSTVAAPSAANPKVTSKLAALATVKLEGAVTTVLVDGLAPKAFSLLVGTAAANVYRVTYHLPTNKLVAELLMSAHADKINGLAFPAGLSEVFATCAFGCARVWHLPTCRELLRIAVPNLDCTCLAFAPDGKSIVTGWSDGRIRAFGPQTGKLLYTINDAHHKAVTALAVSSDNVRIVSGGDEGYVRVWRVGRGGACTMEASMKDHKGPVHCVTMKPTSDDECVTASHDGSCIIWDLKTMRRHASLFGNTNFYAAAYHPDGSQVVTAGTDRKLTYWDAFDGKEIRVVDGSDSDPLLSLALDADGATVVSGGADKLVKAWGYDAGECIATGVGHSGAVVASAVTPDRSKIVTVGSEGGIFVWACPPPPVTPF